MIRECADCEKRFTTDDPVCELCPSCQDNENERLYQRFCERYYGGEVETAREEQIRTWEEKRRLHQ